MEVVTSIREINELLLSFNNSNVEIIDLSSFEEKITYNELGKRVEDQANKWEKLGVISGSCVLISIPTSISMIVHILSLMKIGATPSPVSNNLSQEGFKHICSNIKPYAIYSKNIFHSDDFDGFGQVDHDLDGKNNLIINSENRYYAEFVNRLILTTSGSTGFPKSILHDTKKSLLNGKLHMESIEERVGGAYLASLSAFFSYGLIAGIFGALITRKKIVITEKPFYPNLWFDYCKKHDITLSSITPGLLKKILKVDCEFPETLKKITVGGEKADLADVEKLREKFNGEIYLTYGLSEAGPRVFTNKITYDSNTWKYMGEPMRGIQISLTNIIDEVTFEQGELIIKSPTNMVGYMISGKIMKTDNFVDECWLLSGDICRREKSTNNIIYISREKNVIKCNGEVIYPGIIRSVILLNEAIEEVTIESIQDNKLGLVPIAYIKLKNGRELPKLKKFCSKYLRLLEIPRKFIVVEDLEFFKK
jgi:acyl-coenzyme A synthetase/AMP-(fatty) acid ligase